MEASPRAGLDVRGRRCLGTATSFRKTESDPHVPIRKPAMHDHRLYNLGPRSRSALCTFAASTRVVLHFAFSTRARARRSALLPPRPASSCTLRPLPAATRGSVSCRSRVGTRRTRVGADPFLRSPLCTLPPRSALALGTLHFCRIDTRCPALCLLDPRSRSPLCTFAASPRVVLHFAASARGHSRLGLLSVSCRHAGSVSCRFRVGTRAARPRVGCRQASKPRRYLLFMPLKSVINQFVKVQILLHHVLNPSTNYIFRCKYDLESVQGFINRVGIYYSCHSKT